MPLILSFLTSLRSLLSFCNFLFQWLKKMARNGVAFTSHFPANQTTLQNTPHTARHFTFTYDDLYNCLYRHNEPQLIDIEAFKTQRKSSQSEGEKQKDPASEWTKEPLCSKTLRANLEACSTMFVTSLVAKIDYLKGPIFFRINPIVTIELIFLTKMNIDCWPLFRILRYN